MSSPGPGALPNGLPSVRLGLGVVKQRRGALNSRAVQQAGSAAATDGGGFLGRAARPRPGRRHLGSPLNPLLKFRHRFWILGHGKEANFQVRRATLGR